MSSAARIAAGLSAAILFLAPALAETERALPASVSVLTRDDFANRHWFSVADVLDQIPSLNVARTGYRGTAASASARGLSGGDAVVIAIDGHPLTNVFDGSVDLSQIPLNMIERIEVTRGGANVMYGPAKAGLVNLVTSRPERKGLTVDLGTQVGRMGAKDSNGRFLLRNWAGDLTYTGGVENSGGYTDNQAAEVQTHFANATRSFKKGGYFGAQYLYTTGGQGTPQGTRVPFDLWDHHRERIAVSTDTRIDRTFQEIRFFVTAPPVADGALRLEYTLNQRDLDSFGAPGQVGNQTNKSGEGRISFSRHGLDLGGERIGYRRNADGSANTALDNSAAYATQNIRAGAWTFQPGVRWDHHSEGGGAPTYRAALLYQPAEDWTASLTGQRAPRFATIDEAFDAAGNGRHLDPEKTDSIDGGLVWDPGRFRLAATYFTESARDVIALSPSTGDLANGARERTAGVETQASGRVGRGNWGELQLRGGWTYQNARRKDIDGTSYGRAPFAPTHLAWAAASLRLPWKMHLTNEVRYKTTQYSGTARTGAKIPPFAVWNSRLDVRIWSADLFFAWDNMLRRRYAESVSAAGALEPQPDQTFWAGINIRFLD